MACNNVNEIINRALRVIRAESKFQGENSEAREYILDSLNDILAVMNANGFLIPYSTTATFNIVPGKRSYTVGLGTGLDVELPHAPLAVDYVNLFQTGFKYSVEIIDDFTALKSVTSDLISGRPYYVVITPQNEFSIFDFYGVPDTAYEIEILYKAALGAIKYQDTIPLPAQYRQWLVYMLAKTVNIEQGIGVWNAVAEERLQYIERTLKASTKHDVRVRSAAPIRPWDEYYNWRLGVNIS